MPTPADFVFNNIALKKGENKLLATGYVNGRQIEDQVTWFLK